MVKQCLEELPEHCRVVLQMRYDQGLCYREMASRLNTSEEAARKLFLRALRVVGESLTGRGLRSTSL